MTCRVVDLFAGFGGATLGAVQAGARVVYAANHNPIAVGVHAANHPDVRHECQDLRQANWSSLPAYDLLWGSPACQGHSTAAQSKPRYRWLTTREIARGMGFPDSYTWSPELTREDVLRGLGNAVPPPVARDVVSAVMRVAQARRAS